MEKGILTKELILEDIVYAKKHYTSAVKRKSELELFFVSAVVAVFAIAIIRTVYSLFLLLIPVAVFAINRILKKYSSEKITVDDFYVEKTVFSCVHYERIKSYIYRNATQMRMELVFEGGSKWEVPYDNYVWSSNFRFDHKAIDNTSVKGNTFYIARFKEKGSIAYAYNDKFFTYEEK